MKHSSPNYTTGRYSTGEVLGQHPSRSTDSSNPMSQLIFLCSGCCLILQSAIFFGQQLHFGEYQQEVHCFCCELNCQRGLMVGMPNHLGIASN